MNLPIIDLHPCIQGEGKFMGVPHLLIRLTGCNLRCSFPGGNICDTPYSSWRQESGKFTEDDLENALREYHHRMDWVMITGGEPMKNPTMVNEICRRARKYAYKISIETNGTIFFPVDVDFITMSPKLESSIPSLEDSRISPAARQQHIDKRYNPDAMKWLMSHTSGSMGYQFKFVITDEDDLEEIEKNYRRRLWIPRENIWLMPEGITNDDLQLNRAMVMELCIREGYNYSDRLQIVAYGHKRGV